MTAADPGQLAATAHASAARFAPGTPERRAAAHLWVALTVPPARSLAAARRAVESFGTEATQAAALALLDELAARDVPAGTARGAAPTERNRS